MLLALGLACSAPQRETAPAQAPEAAPAAVPSTETQSPASTESTAPNNPEDERAGTGLPIAESLSDGGATSNQGEPPEPARLPPFVPAPFTPPFERSAKPGDGKWTPIGDGALSELAASEPHVLYRTTVHPHEISPFIAMEVVAIDLSRLRLNWAIGTKDHLADKLKEHQTPGLVPSDLQESTYAIFNGGFQARHGWWGQMSHGVTLVKPKDEGCTVALYEDGAVRLGRWSELSATQAEMRAFRQTPPCLLHEGTIHPRLERGNDKAWAGKNPTRKTRRRSALGINADGSVLYFAIGSETGPVDLARGMQAVGATSALQLDINWAWARFLTVGRREGKPRVTSTLVKDSLHGKNEYFSYPSHRDFFYLTRRPTD